MTPKIGSRLYSAAGSVEIIVVSSPAREVALTCGSSPVNPASSGRAPDDLQDVPVGKRFEDIESGLEVLVTKGGTGPLAVDGRPMLLKVPKRLPASD